MLEVQFGLVLDGQSVIRSRRGDCLEAINHRSPCKDAARNIHTIRRLEVLRKARDSCSFSPESMTIPGQGSWQTLRFSEVYQTANCRDESGL